MEGDGKNWCIWRTQSRLLFNILALTHKAQWKWTFWMWILLKRNTCTNLRDLFRPPTPTSWMLNAKAARILPLSFHTLRLQLTVKTADKFCVPQREVRQNSLLVQHGDVRETESDLLHNRGRSFSTSLWRRSVGRVSSLHLTSAARVNESSLPIKRTNNLRAQTLRKIWNTPLKDTGQAVWFLRIRQVYNLLYCCEGQADTLSAKRRIRINGNDDTPKFRLSSSIMHGREAWSNTLKLASPSHRALQSY